MLSQAELISKTYHWLVPCLNISIFLETVWVLLSSGGVTTLHELPTMSFDKENYLCGICKTELKLPK